MRKSILLLVFVASTSHGIDRCDRDLVIEKMRPGAEWNLRGDKLEWLDTVQLPPTDKEIDTATAECLVRVNQEKAAKVQAKTDLNTKTKTDADRIDAIIKYLDLDK